MKEPKLVLFDGNAIIHRAFHALPPLTVKRTGETVGAVYGFAQMLLKVINDIKPSHCAIAFDRAAPTFRHELYDQYKANRPETPVELVNQFGRVKELVEAFHIPIFELDGYEADDVLGTLSHQAKEQGIDTIIVTGDADIMQLVNEKVNVLYPRPKGGFSNTDLFNEEEVIKKYGIKPENIADFKALKGDPSDNIPGVPGIGEKTATKLIQQFGSLENIYENIDIVKPPKTQKLLRENKDIARQSKKLATIVIDTPVTLEMADCVTSEYDRNTIVTLLRELEFSSLIRKLPQTTGFEQGSLFQVTAEPAPTDYHIIINNADLDALMQRLSSTGILSFDTETTSLNTMSAELVGISLSPAPGEAYYIPVGHVGWANVEQLSLDLVTERLKPVFADSNLTKYAHNGKYDMIILAEHGLPVSNMTFDSMIAAHLLNEQSIGLKSLAFNRIGVEMTPISELIGSGSKQLSMSQVEIQKAGIYACADADMTFQLCEILKPELEQQSLRKLFTEVEMPLVPVLVTMERHGIALDTDLLSEMSHEIGRQLIDIEGKIYGIAGHQFNINSPQQLGNVLFEEMKLPATKRKGNYSTSAAILEALREENPIIGNILDYRQLSKLKSTYIDTLPGMVNHKTGRLHTSYNQTRTATGRLSSSDPNLQNIPVRGEQGKQIRHAFIAPGNSSLLGADYSQIDLRALAHLSQDENLCAAFQHDEDIHTATASQLYGVKATEVTPDMRRLAKTVNFGVIYGMSEYGLERATELSREEASQFITAYFEKYPGIRKYLESTKQQARETGYVETLLGRKRSIAEINAPNRNVREGAERMAINMPVQGTSADIIKVAMINLDKEMNKRNLKSKMMLQVHDELVFEVPQSELAEMQELVPELMTGAVKLHVPVKVDTKTGSNWGEME